MTHDTCIHWFDFPGQNWSGMLWDSCLSSLVYCLQVGFWGHLQSKGFRAKSIEHSKIQIGQRAFVFCSLNMNHILGQSVKEHMLFAIHRTRFAKGDPTAVHWTLHRGSAPMVLKLCSFHRILFDETSCRRCQGAILVHHL